MKFRRILIGATLVACAVAACDRTPEDSAGLTENAEESAEKAMAADETTPVEAMRRPETPAERREMRLKLAGQQAEKLTGLDRVAADDSEPSVGEVPAEMMEKIISDMMARTGASRADIKVLRAESLIWPDGSLGCGKPGEMYTQAVVPGYRVILGHNGQTFDYRGTQKGHFMLCEQPTLTRPGAGGEPPAQ